MLNSDRTTGGEPSSRWFREYQFWLLILLVLAIYFPRMTDLSVRGEETRRAQVAVEMLETGDWIVPRQQGQIYLSRPPMQNWLMALVGRVRGEVDQIAIRLPSSLAILLTTILIYGYSRLFLKPTASLVSGAAFITMGQVIELGWLGETEAVFTLFVSASLLLWHWGDQREWSPWLKWGLPYLMVAYGCLAKGFQAPVYFAATVGLYLLYKRRWKEAASLPHLAGILIFFAVWGSWQLAYLSQSGLENSQNVYMRMINQRFDSSSPMTVLTHMAEFPLHTFFCTLPWSGLLFVLCYPGFWKTVGQAQSQLFFLGTSVIIAFLSLWMVPGAVTRYLMPVYPCLAIIIGLVAQRCWENEDSKSLWSQSWRWQVRFVAGAICAVAVVLLTVTMRLDPTSMDWQPTGFAIAFSVWCMVLAATLGTLSRRNSRENAILTTLTMVVFVGTTFMGPWVNRLIRHTPATEQAVAEVRELIPAGERFVSIGRIYHPFAYHWKEFIPVVDPQRQAVFPDDVTYFCFNAVRRNPSRIYPNFQWKKLGEIVCDRWILPNPNDVVIIGRRLTPDESPSAPDSHRPRLAADPQPSEL
ncbi:MAG: glycosyltransferase family 39 protein [Planctomycetaceae bacterium]|nr:glycosyltransferase family 39 protein [Planctomycetaceae bacterium]